MLLAAPQPPRGAESQGPVASELPTLGDREAGREVREPYGKKGGDGGGGQRNAQKACQVLLRAGGNHRPVCEQKAGVLALFLGKQTAQESRPEHIRASACISSCEEEERGPGSEEGQLRSGTLEGHA